MNRDDNINEYETSQTGIKALADQLQACFESRGFIKGDGDVISRLPSDLIIAILSRLTLKEAVATSVLSRRWEKLWTFYHGNLDLEFSKGLYEKRCSYYARVVNKVLDTLELVEGGGVFDSFTICFNLCPNDMSYVDKWVQFALEKRRVKRLTFDPYTYTSNCSRYKPVYDFPPLRCFYAKKRNIQALISISFQNVNVSGEIIEHFLSNCPLLERLDLINSSKPLIHLRVSGETLALKHLIISSCNYLTTIEICAPKLISLHYEKLGTASVDFFVRNVPMLVDFSFGYLETPSLTASALHLLSCFSHIQKLLLYVCSKGPEDFTKLIKLPSLKHCTMMVSGRDCEHILAWTPLLKAFPVLEKFTLDMKDRKRNMIYRVTRDHDKFPSQCFKVFEFLGFGQIDGDIELALYFLKSTVVPLEKIILHCDGGALPTPYYNDCVDEAVNFAAKLKQIIPKKVNLVCLSPHIPILSAKR